MLAPLLHGHTSANKALAWHAACEREIYKLEYDVACCGLERLYQRWAITRRQYLDGVVDAFMRLMRELTR